MRETSILGWVEFNPWSFFFLLFLFEQLKNFGFEILICEKLALFFSVLLQGDLTQLMLQQGKISPIGQCYFWNKCWKFGVNFLLGGVDRAYDRAAIKFRGVDADINFNIGDYEDDIKQVGHVRCDFLCFWNWYSKLILKKLVL